MKNPTFISIQGSYSELELALFKNLECLEKIKENNRKASSQLIPLLDQILKNNSLTLKDIQFICTDQGPGAFTSLRVAIATVNGLGFANKIPLIGIDGLDALSQETIKNFSQPSHCPFPQILVTLLNAYNNDVYFSVNKIDSEKNLELITEGELGKGYKKIDMLLGQIKSKFKDEMILFSGNGAKLHEELILKIFEQRAIIPPTLQLTCSVEQVAKTALEKWRKMEKKDYKFKLFPLYLKSQTFTARPGAVLPGHTSNTS